MRPTTPFTRAVRRRGAATLAALALGVGALSACSVTSAATSATSAEGSVWDSTSVHEVELDIDEDEYAEMLATYQESSEKEWLTADVTIDGQTFSDAGIRLKGNSSLRGVDADADAVDLPWLIDLDKFVDGQSLDGWERFVVRSNTSETALNEAVALELLEEAGLASEEAASISFSANDSESSLRLMVQDLDDRGTRPPSGPTARSTRPRQVGTTPTAVTTPPPTRTSSTSRPAPRTTRRSPSSCSGSRSPPTRSSPRGWPSVSTSTPSRRTWPSRTWWATSTTSPAPATTRSCAGTPRPGR